MSRARQRANRLRPISRHNSDRPNDNVPSATYTHSDEMAMLQLEKELEKLTKSARLSEAVDDVDKIINLLTEARQKVAESGG